MPAKSTVDTVDWVLSIVTVSILCVSSQWEYQQLKQYHIKSSNQSKLVSCIVIMSNFYFVHCGLLEQIVTSALHATNLSVK